MIQRISKRSLFLIAADLTGVALSLYLSFLLRLGGDAEPALFHQPFSYLPFIIFPILFYIFDLYYPYKHFAPGRTLVDIFVSISLGGIVLAALSYMNRSMSLPSRIIFVAAGVNLFFSVFLIRLLYDRFFASRILDKKALIIGTGSLAQALCSAVLETPYAGIRLMGFAGEPKTPTLKHKQPVLGAARDVDQLVVQHGIQMLILAEDDPVAHEAQARLASWMRKGVSVVSGIDLFELLKGEIPFQVLTPDAMLSLMTPIKSRPYLKLKRFIDVLSALMLLVLSGPLWIIIMTLLRTQDQGGVFFVQRRIGKEGRPFDMIKFRSMTHTGSGRAEVTSFGKWMRRYRMDELPQLINILKGDMSLVGPRPEIPYFVERCRKRIPYYDAVFAVKPGLTGWAQVRFHHVTSLKGYDQKFRLNLFYLKNVSFFLDLLVLLQTVRVVLLGKGR